MKCISIHLPEAHTPVAIVLGSALPKRVLPSHEQSKSSPDFVYVHFELSSETLSESCRKRLEGWGVSCLEAGEEYRAYGIVENDPELFSIFRADPEIVEIELQEPCCGK